MLEQLAAAIAVLVDRHELRAVRPALGGDDRDLLVGNRRLDRRAARDERRSEDYGEAGLSGVGAGSAAFSAPFFFDRLDMFMSLLRSFDSGVKPK